MFELSHYEKELVKNSKIFLNEYTLARAKHSRTNSAKKVKSRRKKTRELEKNLKFSKATPTHAFEALLGSIKMQFILYLRLDVTIKEVNEWVYGIEKTLARSFMSDVRAEVCRDIIGVYEKDWCLFKPLALSNWFFKSGFLKRSNNLFKELYGDIIQYAYAEEIRQLRDDYIFRAGEMMKSGEDLEKILFNETINVPTDDYDFFISINQSKKTMDLILEDMQGDKQFLKKAKYIRSQLGTACQLMRDYLEQNSDELERMSNMHTEIKERMRIKADREKLKEELGPYFNIIDKSCKMAGFELSEATRGEWESYYKSLKQMKKKDLAEERKWLGVA
jgi:hypothetical protein